MMSQEHLSSTISNRNLASESPLQSLLTQSLATLETLLQSEAISAPERAEIALRILGITGDAISSEPIPAVSHEDALPAVDSTAVLITNSSHQTTQAEQEVSEDWKRWIAENKLLNRTDDSIIEAMVRNGIDQQLAIQAVDRIAFDPCFQAGTNIAQLLRKLESVLETNQKVAELSPNFGTIERRSRLSRQEFFENYYSQNRPVIFTDMMGDWSAMSQWSPEYLRTKYGNVQVEIQANRNTDPEFELNKNRLKTIVKLSEYVDMVVRGGETNNYYLTANNGALDRPELKSLLDDIQMFPEFLDGSDTHNKVFFWFGPAGTITPLHHDANHLMMAQVSGRKRWKIISPNQTPLLYNYVGVFSKVDCESPDCDRYPLFSNARIIETVMEPGEVIYLPVGWWHQVKSLDISFSVSFTNFVFPNLYDYKNPNIPTW
jgi:hypothetical protein